MGLKRFVSGDFFFILATTVVEKDFQIFNNNQYYV